MLNFPSISLCLSVLLFVCLINPCSSQPLLLSFSCICIVWSAAALQCRLRLSHLFTLLALRESQLIFIYFNVAPPYGAWHRQWQLVVFPSASNPRNFMHYLQIYWPSFATKMKLLKFSFIPCPVSPPPYTSFFSSLCWTGKQSNNCFFAVCTPLLVFMHAQSYVVNVVTTTIATTTKFFAYFHFAQHELRL